MSIATLVVGNYIMVAELLGLWFLLDSNVHLKKRTIVMTRVVILLIFSEAVLWAIERYTRELGYLTWTRILLTPTVYLLHPLIMIGIMDMAEFLKKHKLLFYLPIILSVPLLYTSQWTHLVYWFNEDNIYIAADSMMCYYPYYLFFGYVILFFVLFTRYTHYGTSERRGILICIIAATVGVILHIIFDIVVDYSTLFASLLLIYYLSLSLLTAKEDTLTHLLNRQCYYADMEKRAEVITAVVSVDMNNLKKLNDTQGHAAGDLAKCLLGNSTRKKRVYRIGGDEFAIFYLGIKEEAVVKDIENMRELLAATPYVCAFGYEMVDNKDIDKTMREADKKMYSNKAKLKDTNENRIAAHREATIKVLHEALGSGMWGMEFDEDGQMISVEWSDEFRRMIGYTDEKDFPNELQSWSERLHPDCKEKVLKAFNEAIDDYSGQKNYDVEYRLKTKSGEWRWYHAIGRLLRREDGTPLSYVGLFVDINDRKMANKSQELPE